MAVTKETRDAIKKNRKELDAKAESVDIQDFFKQHVQLMGKRKDSNLKLIAELKELVYRHPEQRFGQIICNYFIDKDETSFFYEEPEDILQRVMEKNKFEEIMDKKNYGK